MSEFVAKILWPLITSPPSTGVAVVCGNTNELPASVPAPDTITCD